MKPPRSIHPLLREIRAVLERHYGQRFKGLILYGSTARGDADAESDIDLLVLLDPPMDYAAELHQLIDLLYPLQLQSERLISVKPAAWEAFEQGGTLFYRRVKAEGVKV